VLAQGVVEGTSHWNVHMARTTSPAIPARGLSIARPKKPRRRRKGAADRQAAGRSTMTAVADDPIPITTTHVTC
jgi:hypothetical protein